MYSKNIPLLGQAMQQAGWSQSLVDAFSQTFGNCQQTLDHSAPIVISANFPDAPSIPAPGIAPNNYMPPTVGDPDDPVGGGSVTPDFENPNGAITGVGDPRGYVNTSTIEVVGTPGITSYGPIIGNGPLVFAGPIVMNRVIMTWQQWKILVNLAQQIQTDHKYPVTNPADWSFDTDECEIVISSDLDLEPELY